MAYQIYLVENKPYAANQTSVPNKFRTPLKVVQYLI